MHMSSHLPFVLYGIFDEEMFQAISNLLCYKRHLKSKRPSKISVNQPREAYEVFD